MNLYKMRPFALASSLALSLVACGSSTSSAPSASADGGVDAGARITGLTPETWTWVGFPDAHCRDGSSTGIGVSVNPKSDKLMIYLEGGGACFNSTTCMINPSCFPESGPCVDYLGQPSTFDSWKTGNATTGIFDRNDAKNPVADWNMVYVPYCTGDVHAGANPSGHVDGVNGTLEFVGYTNVSKYLTRLVPTFNDVSQVLLTGVSAGGFGAGINYVQVAQAFAPTPVDMLDDSGPFMDDPYIPTCEQAQWVTTWGLDKTALAACGADCPDHTRYVIDGVKHNLRLYPKATFGLVESSDDAVMTLFLGFGGNNCAPAALPTQVPAATFLAGLEDIRSQLAAFPNFGAFIFSGTNHPSLIKVESGSGSFDTRVAGGSPADGGAPEGGAGGAPDGGGGVMLTDWVGQLVNGTVSNVGP